MPVAVRKTSVFDETLIPKISVKIIEKSGSKKDEKYITIISVTLLARENRVTFKALLDGDVRDVAVFISIHEKANLGLSLVFYCIGRPCTLHVREDN